MRCSHTFLKPLLLAACIALTHFVRAEISIGARYGAGLSTVYFAPNQDERMTFTPSNFGLAFRYCDKKAPGYERHMNLLVEFGYADRRNRFDPRLTQSAKNPLIPADSGAFGKRATFKARALELPVIMQLRLPLTKSQNLCLLVSGIVYGAYYLQSSMEYTFNSVPMTDGDAKKRQLMRGFEYGVGGGLGISLRTGRLDYAVDARYTASMSSLYKQNVPPDVYISMPMQVIFSFCIMCRIW